MHCSHDDHLHFPAQLPPPTQTSVRKPDVFFPISVMPETARPINKCSTVDRAELTRAKLALELWLVDGRSERIANLRRSGVNWRQATRANTKGREVYPRACQQAMKQSKSDTHGHSRSRQRLLDSCLLLRLLAAPAPIPLDRFDPAHPEVVVQRQQR